MTEAWILAAGFVGGVAGGAIGARLAAAAAWKGGLIAGLATILQFAVASALDLEGIVLVSLLYLVAAGLVGGRWGLGLTGRQISIVVIGSFLFAVMAGFAAIRLTVTPVEG
ncbi:hypothetical protein VQH23_16530 [Pararoseomonas sp. SCSIO 73927]|uniref:hypothetical protein n=1 Tax=Pararoseomonas sp. SCSIO 73927 TaxID=3114537 RepID=UPI0030D038BD